MENQVTKKQDDFSEEEERNLQEYVKKGCPGLARVDEQKTFEWFQLYMSGKSYGEIATICSTKKELILYISQKLKWHEKRMSHYSDLSMNLMTKINQTKMDSINTISTMAAALNMYFSEKFINYLRTKDSSHIEGVDSKMLAQYYKSLEVMEKLIGGSATEGGSKIPSVNIHVGSNAEVKQSQDGSIEVNDNSAKDILHALAKYKKKLTEEEED